MDLGGAYRRAMRLPSRRDGRGRAVTPMSPRRRKVRAALLMAMTVVAGRGVVEMALRGGTTPFIVGVAAVALGAWFIARRHLATARRGSTRATALGITLATAILCAYAMHRSDMGRDALTLTGLRRIAFTALVMAALTSVAAAMAGIRPAAIEDER